MSRIPVSRVSIGELLQRVGQLPPLTNEEILGLSAANRLPVDVAYRQRLQEIQALEQRLGAERYRLLLQVVHQAKAALVESSPLKQPLPPVPPPLNPNTPPPFPVRSSPAVPAFSIAKSTDRPSPRTATGLLAQLLEPRLRMPLIIGGGSIVLFMLVAMVSLWSGAKPTNSFEPQSVAQSQSIEESLDDSSVPAAPEDNSLADLPEVSADPLSAFQEPTPPMEAALNSDPLEMIDPQITSEVPIDPPNVAITSPLTIPATSDSSPAKDSFPPSDAATQSSAVTDLLSGIGRDDWKIQLATAPLQDGVRVDLKLDASAAALSDDQTLKLEKKGDGSWHVLLSGAKKEGLLATSGIELPIGRIEQENTHLHFVWEHKAPSADASQLVNCVLEIRTDQHSHLMSLRRPVVTHRYALDLSNDVGTFPIAVDIPPKRNAMELSVKTRGGNLQVDPPSGGVPFSKAIKVNVQGSVALEYQFELGTHSKGYSIIQKAYCQFTDSKRYGFSKAKLQAEVEVAKKQWEISVQKLEQAYVRQVQIPIEESRVIDSNTTPANKNALLEGYKKERVVVERIIATLPSLIEKQEKQVKQVESCLAVVKQRHGERMFQFSLIANTDSGPIVIAQTP